MRQTEVQRLAAAHRQSGERPMFAIGLDGIPRLDRRNHILKQVLFEGRKGRGRGIDVALRTVVLLRPAVGHHHNHGHGLPLGQQVVEEDVRMRKPLPLRFITTDAVQEVKHGILLVRRITGRGIDLHLARCAHRFRVVFDHLQLAVRNAIALCVKPCWRIVESRFVVRLQFDRSPKSARSRTGPLAARRVRGTCE